MTKINYYMYFISLIVFSMIRINNLAIDNMITGGGITYEYVNICSVQEFEVIPEPVIPDVYIQPINDDYNVFKPSNLTVEDLTRMLDYRDGLKSLVYSFVQAEEDYGVNSLYLMATIGGESGWGKYTSGYNNLAGWKPDGIYADFSSRHECIMTIAEGLSTSFRETQGDRLADVTLRYSPDYQYTQYIQELMGELLYNY